MGEARLILIDTNVFLELLLGREKSEDCEALLDAVSKGEVEAVVTHFTVHAVEATLGAGQALITFLRSLESSEGLYVYETGISEEISTAMLAPKIGLDFDDALQYYASKRLGVEAIVSFDMHLDDLDIPRIEPSGVINQKR